MGPWAHGPIPRWRYGETGHGPLGPWPSQPSPRASPASPAPGPAGPAWDTPFEGLPGPIQPEEPSNGPGTGQDGPQKGPIWALPGPSWEAHMAIVNPLNMGAYKGFWPQEWAQNRAPRGLPEAPGRPILGLFWGPFWEASWEGLGGSRGPRRGIAHMGPQKGSKGPLEGPQNRAYFGGPFGPSWEALLNSIMKESLENRHQMAQGP